MIDASTNQIADILKVKPSEIIYTSGSSEANNTAIMAVQNRNWGNRVITTEIEHPSVLQTVKRLEEKGFEIIRLKSQADGKISLEDLKNALSEKTVLVSIMLVNNETGAIQPIAQAVELVRKLSPRALFHCDAVQAFGKIPVNVKALGVDLMTVSGHKVHAPKGIGFLYCKKGVKIPAFITGGGQERGMRSGTESVPLAAAFEGAVKEMPEINLAHEKISDIKNYAIKLFNESGFIKINSPEDSIPYILNISVRGYRSETLLHFLESKNIFVSSGSACAKGETSYVLGALGLDKMEIDSALRISFSRETVKEEIDELYNALKEATQKLRRSEK